MEKLSMTTIKRRIEDIFAEYGCFLCVDKEDLDNMFIPEEVKLISDGLVPHRDMEGEVFIHLQDFATVLCKENGYYLDQFVLDDIVSFFVLSFSIKDFKRNSEVTSFHNVYVYC